MKKTIALVCAMLLLCSFVFAKGANETAKAPAKVLTLDELTKAAQAEGNLNIYTFSSRGAKVAEAFEKKYGIKTTSTQLKDTEMIEKVSTEAMNNVAGADIIFAQDSSRVYPELIMTNYVSNYIPPEYVNLIDPNFNDPLVYDFCNKIFAYNNEKGGAPVHNVWQLTEPQFKGLIQFKDPFQESVNMNFLTMLTNPEWSKKLADSYKKLYGKDLKLDADCKNAGYQWIKDFYKNIVFGKSDTTIAEAVGAKGQDKQLIGVFTYNKFRNNAAKNLALDFIPDMEPFAGFMYPVYAQIPSNSRNTNAAKLYLYYSLTEEGWEPFSIVGDYSPKSDLINKEDPISFDQWTKMLVVEDPVWCSQNRAEVEEFVNKAMNNK